MHLARSFTIAAVITAFAVSGCEWSFQTLDGDGGSHGQSINAVGSASSAVVYNGRPHVFFYDASDDDLRHGYWNGQFWAFEILDGHQNGPHGQISGPAGRWSSVLADGSRTRVFYAGGLPTNNLRHAWFG